MKKTWPIILAGAAGVGLGSWLHQCTEVPGEQKKDCDCGCGGSSKVTPQSSELPDDQGYSGRNDLAPESVRAITRNLSKGRKTRSPKTIVARREPKPSIPLRVGHFEQQHAQALNEKYKKAQVSLYNPTDQELSVTLWAANQENEQVETAISRSLILEEANHIQAMGWNPANQFLYVISQLSNSVSVISSNGELETEISLEPNSFPGTNSPVDLEIQTDPGKPSYGFVYVIGSVANTVTVISPDHQVTTTIETGVRPVNIAFNSDKTLLYVANLGEHSICVIDPVSLESIQKLQTPVSNPLAIEPCSSTGDLFVVYLESNTVSILSSDGVLIENLDSTLVDPNALTYHPSTDQMLLVDEMGKAAKIDCQNLELEVLSFQVASFHFDEGNQRLYALSPSGSLSQLDQSFTHLESEEINGELIAFDGSGDPIGLNPTSNTIYWTSNQTQGIVFDEDYLERRQDFKYNPALIKHVRFHISGELPFQTLNLVNQTATGKSHSTTLSMSDYQSPQNFQKVYEVTGMNGSMIDGKTGWQFKVAPGQRISTLIYYEQFEMYRLVPEHSRKSIPIM